MENSATLPRYCRWALGLALLLTLMVVVFYSDFSKFGITDKMVRWWRGEEAMETDHGAR